jgi:hypothetical protein
MTTTTMTRPGNKDPRRNARRTAVTIGLIAFGLYVAFILSGVIGR